jgi:sarcosine oxidase
MRRYDTVIIGLGAMGSATAWHLARRDKSVLGLEQFAAGHEHGSSHGESRIIRLAYFEHPSYVPLLRAAYRLWGDLEEQSGEAILTRTGILECGISGSRIVAGSLEASRLHAIPHDILDAKAIRARFPAFDPGHDWQGVFQPDGGFLRPEKAIAAMRTEARKAGAELYHHCPVLGIEASGQSVRVRLAEETIEAESVIVSAGAWMHRLLPEFKHHVSLVRRVLGWFEPRDPALLTPDRFPVFLMETEDDAPYGFPDFAGTGFKCASHWSGGPIAEPEEIGGPMTAAEEKHLSDILKRYIPAAAGPLLASKPCIYTKTPDEDFLIDLHPQDRRIVIASPCSGHGFKFASVIGEILADLATKGETTHDISRFALARFRQAA